jgi:hypothetical protein
VPLAVAAAAVLLVGGLGIGIGLARSGGDDNNAAAVGSSSAPVVSSATSTAPSATISSSQPGPSVSVSTSSSQPTATAPPTLISLPIYYVADMNGSGNRLYREFSDTAVGSEGRAYAALRQMFGDAASDGDYQSLWPLGVRVNSLTVDGDLAKADVSALPTGSPADQLLGVQQAVWTITGADPTIKRVQFTVNGAAPSSAALAAPTARANALDVLANVWLLDPFDGANTKSPVTIKVYGTGFEGNVPIKIFRASDGVQVAQDAVTTMMGGFATASAKFRLPAGDYKVLVYNENGKNGALELWDSKTFAVG